MGLFTAGPVRVIPTSAREVFDGTGAGDTVIAVTGMGLAAGGRIEDSVRLASAAAGVEVGKLGCALVSREEIRAAL
jgi:D-beta-D-heptose 7-phosphate kinase/D-beta-D-heptose 1-phosphate adenosyltransferase